MQILLATWAFCKAHYAILIPVLLVLVASLKNAFTAHPDVESALTVLQDLLSFTQRQGSEGMKLKAPVLMLSRKPGSRPLDLPPAALLLLVPLLWSCATAKGAVEAAGSCVTAAMQKQVGNLYQAVLVVLSGQDDPTTALEHLALSVGTDTLNCTVEAVVNDLASKSIHGARNAAFSRGEKYIIAHRKVK